jgi:hypothetical protein
MGTVPSHGAMLRRGRLATSKLNKRAAKKKIEQKIAEIPKIFGN